MRSLLALLGLTVLLAACGTDDGSSATTTVGPSESSTTTAAPRDRTATTAPADDTTPTTAPAVRPPLPPPTSARFANRDTAPFILESTGVSPDGELVVGTGPAGGLCRASTERPDAVDWCADVETEDLYEVWWGPGGQLAPVPHGQPLYVVDGSGEIIETPSVASEMGWSPDGTRLIGVEIDLDLETFEVLGAELVIIDAGDGGVERTGIATVDRPSHVSWLADDRVVVAGRTDSSGTPRIDLVDLNVGATVRTQEYPEVSSFRFEDHDVDRGVLLFDVGDEGVGLVDIETGSLTVVPNPTLEGSPVRMVDAELAPDSGSVLSFGRYRDERDLSRLLLASVAVDPEAGTSGEWAVLQTWPGDEPITPYDGGDSLRWVDDDLAFAVTDGSRTLIEIELTR